MTLDDLQQEEKTWFEYLASRMDDTELTAEIIAHYRGIVRKVEAIYERENNVSVESMIITKSAEYLTLETYAHKRAEELTRQQYNLR